MQVGLTAVIVAVTREIPRILTVSLPSRAEPEPSNDCLPALPFGPLDPTGDRTLDLSLRRWVKAQTGLELGYVEQLYTFGDRFRHPQELEGGDRVLTVAYLALVREGPSLQEGDARWLDGYQFFPWEDWREGQPRVLREFLYPRLEQWIEAAPPEQRELRRERAHITFGVAGTPWDGYQVLERYELLYALDLVPEALRDQGKPAAPARSYPTGQEMAFDHRRILATALGRMRGKLRYRPVIFELLPESFTLWTLQSTVEALAGVRLHKQNFRRLVEHGRLVEGTGRLIQTGGRPAELFRFRREVLTERRAPGVGLPVTR
ncbi:MAG: hypothetical protein HY319_17930 [Armatimonadetes bacterium]|nr:hypothetical protein [Armatimonadota bacterium]